MPKTSRKEEQELVEMQNKVSSILYQIFRNINGIIDYQNRRGANYDPGLKTVITQVLEALKSVESTERGELIIITALERIDRRFKVKGLRKKITSIVVDEEMLKRELETIIQHFNRDSLKKIILLENDLKRLMELVKNDLNG